MNNCIRLALACGLGLVWFWGIEIIMLIVAYMESVVNDAAPDA